MSCPSASVLQNIIFIKNQKWCDDRIGLDYRTIKKRKRRREQDEEVWKGDQGKKKERINRFIRF